MDDGAMERNLDGDTFKQILGSFPTGVAVITAIDAAGTPRGLTGNALSAVSAEPPLLLITIGDQSNTLPALLETGTFVVNFLSMEGESIARLFASKEENKFAGIRWRPSASAGGAPVLLEATIAYAECAVQERLHAGDHWIFVARVVGGACNDTLPLGYYRRNYFTWAESADLPRAHNLLGAKPVPLPAQADVRQGRG